MTKSPSRRDLENLSAYLDGQLSPSQTRKLEAQLNRTPDLQRALEDLRQTRRVLRLASQARAPRNFTLTPEMAGKRVSAPRGYTAMRLVAVTATLMFAFVFAGDFLLGNRLVSDVALAPAAEPAMEAYSMQDVADEAKVEALEEAEAPMALEVTEPELSPAPDQERAVEGEADAGEPAPTEAGNMKSASEDTAGVDDLQMTGTPTMMGTPLPPEQVLPVDPEGSPFPAGVGGAIEEVEPTDGDMPLAGVSVFGEDELEESVDTPEELPAPKAKIPLIHIVEGGLILIAVLSGGLALYLRSRVK